MSIARSHKKISTRIEIERKKKKQKHSLNERILKKNVHKVMPKEVYTSEGYRCL